MQAAILTGEPSGDRVGGQLATEIHRLRPDWNLWGSGGHYMRDAGVDVLIDSSRWGIVGIVSGVQILPQVLRARTQLFGELKRRRPEIIIPIDAGAFHLGFGGVEGLCPWVRRNLPDTKILYYFPPGSWRRTLTRTSLAENADLVATPFEWSASELNRLGARAEWVGHPLLDLVKPSRPSAEFAAQYGLDTERPIVGLLPGSRRQEIDQMLPRLFDAAYAIHRRVPGVQFVLGLAPTVDRRLVLGHLESHRAQQRRRREMEQSLKAENTADDTSEIPIHVPLPVPAEGWGKPDDLLRRQREWRQRATQPISGGDGEFGLVIAEQAAYDVMAVSDALIVASGTATLEAAILGKPMVILYAMSAWNKPQYWIVQKSLPRHVGLPNLLAGREICPEFLQEQATGENLASAVIDLLLEPERLLTMRAELQKVREMLGEPGGAARTAEWAVRLASEAIQREQT